MTTPSSAIRWTAVIMLLMIGVTVSFDHTPWFWATMGCLLSGIGAVWVDVWRRPTREP